MKYDSGMKVEGNDVRVKSVVKNRRHEHYVKAFWAVVWWKNTNFSKEHLHPPTFHS
jgi:hypothetical protein